MMKHLHHDDGQIIERMWSVGEEIGIDFQNTLCTRGHSYVYIYRQPRVHVLLSTFSSYLTPKKT